MVVIYIAGPYTIGDVAVNVKNQLDTADQLMDLGYCPIVPLFTHFQHLHKPRPYKDWLKIDKIKVSLCDALLRLPGESKGADQEIEWAKEFMMPVFYSIEELKAIKAQEVS